MRFINADGYFSTGQGTNGHNMFAYCENNPVMYSDPTGECSILAAIATFILADIVVDALADVLSNDSAPASTPKPKGKSYHTDELRICTDGASKSYGSGSHQSQTAMSGRLGINTPADEIPYIVIPTDYPGYDNLIGCMGVVIDNSNGNFAYAVIGDGGKPENGFGEVSLKAAWDLGFSESEAYGACGPEGDFTIMIFPDTRQNWTNSDPYDQIQAAGKLLYP